MSNESLSYTVSAILSSSLSETRLEKYQSHPKSHKVVWFLSFRGLETTWFQKATTLSPVKEEKCKSGRIQATNVDKDFSVKACFVVADQKDSQDASVL